MKLSFDDREAVLLGATKLSFCTLGTISLQPHRSPPSLQTYRFGLPDSPDCDFQTSVFLTNFLDKEERGERREELSLLLVCYCVFQIVGMSQKIRGDTLLRGLYTADSIFYSSLW